MTASGMGGHAADNCSFAGLGYQAGVRPIRQENKLLVPAAFSPVR